jgi:hypothetical protein
MASQRTFGRRIDPQRTQANTSLEFTAANKAAEVNEPPAVRLLPLADIDDPPSVDDELREWKRTRGMHIPWSQFALMASLCFGIGSFVLPEYVNSDVQWLLWGLTAVSAYVWFSKRRARAKSAAG